MGLHAGTFLAIDLFSRLTPTTNGGWGVYDLTLVLILTEAVVLVVLTARSGSFVNREQASKFQTDDSAAPSSVTTTAGPISPTASPTCTDTRGRRQGKRQPL